MKRILIFITLLFIFVSCSQNKKSPPPKDYIPFVTVLNSNDSIDCWAIQFNETFYVETMEFASTDYLYFGLHYITIDSIFSFFYPCTNYKNESYILHGKTLIIPGEQIYRVEINKDTLRVQGNSIDEFSSKEIITLDSYVKMRIPTSILIDMYGVKEDTTCEGSHDKLENCMTIWPHYESIPESGNTKYKPF